MQARVDFMTKNIVQTLNICLTLKWLPAPMSHPAVTVSVKNSSSSACCRPWVGTMSTSNMALLGKKTASSA